MIRGYARVSTQEQNLDLQIAALTAAGCEMANIYTDRISGMTEPAERPGWIALWKTLANDDTVVIWRLDRLVRGLRYLLELVDVLDKYAIHLVSLTETIDTRGASGRLTLHVFGALAQFERTQMAERVTAGLAAARARGQALGRRRALTPAQVILARKLRDEGETNGAIGHALGVSRKTAEAAVRRTGAYSGTT